MHNATIIEAVRRHAVPVHVETAAHRLLDPIDPSVSMVLEDWCVILAVNGQPRTNPLTLRSQRRSLDRFLT
jgi:hypothetical protein